MLTCFFSKQTFVLWLHSFIASISICFCRMLNIEVHLWHLLPLFTMKKLYPSLFRKITLEKWLLAKTRGLTDLKHTSIWVCIGSWHGPSFINRKTYKKKKIFLNYKCVCTKKLAFTPTYIHLFLLSHQRRRFRTLQCNGPRLISFHTNIVSCLTRCLVIIYG